MGTATGYVYGLSSIQLIPVEKQHYKNHAIHDLVSILQEVPQSDKLHVYLKENLSGEFPLLYPFRLSHYIVIFMLEESIVIEVDFIKQVLKKNDVMIASPNSILQLQHIHNKAKVYVLSFSSDYLIENQMNNDFHLFSRFLLKVPPKKNLREFQIDELVALVQTLKTKNERGNTQLYKAHIVSHLFNAIVYELASIYMEGKEENLELSRKDEIAYKFLTLLKENFKKEHSVKFYADALCISADHLSGVLKQIFGKSTLKLINEFLIAESKILLSDQHLTIADIAHELYFGDQSHFGKFFKSNTGYSPNQFRSNLLH
tara:strand:- start:32567 stop:33514 length:948 start_codon:yes stop_codon:yes gene_type:complete